MASTSASANAIALDPASPLALLLQTVPQSTRHTLDFSGLDPITYAILCDAATQSAQEKAQDAELRMALTSKNRILETKLERAHREHDEALADVDVAKRAQDQAKAALAAAQNQAEGAEAAKKTALQDLAKARRDSQAVKVAARQAKLSNERSIARQRERFSDAAILATRNASSTLVTVPSVFDAPLASSSSSSSSSLSAQQVAELETQRGALLSANSALRRLYTEALNAFNDLSASIANPASSSVPARALQSDLFPKGMTLSKGYDLSRSSSSATTHPAVRALSQAIGAGELAVHEWEGERRQLKETLKASQAAAAAAPTDSEEMAEAAASVPRKGPSRIALAASASSSSAAASATAHAEQQRQIQALKSRLAERDAEVHRIEERLEEALRESDGASARIAQAEERVQEMEAMRQREMEEMAKEKEKAAARAAAGRPVIRPSHGDESLAEQSSLSLALEPLSATKKTRARRMQVELPPPVADELQVEAESGPTGRSGPSTSSSSLKRTREHEKASPAEDGTFSITVPSEAVEGEDVQPAAAPTEQQPMSKRARRSDHASSSSSSSSSANPAAPSTSPPSAPPQQQQQQRRVLSSRPAPNSSSGSASSEATTSSNSKGSRVVSSSTTTTATAKTKRPATTGVPMSSTPAPPVRKMVSAATKKRQEAAGEAAATVESTPAPPGAAAAAATKKRTVATPSVLQAALERRRRGGAGVGGGGAAAEGSGVPTARRTVSGGR